MLPRFPIGTASHTNVSRCGALVKWHERAAAWHKMGTEACDKGREKVPSGDYWIELAASENTLFALLPIMRMVPTTMTRMTASMTAYSAMSCPWSSDQSLDRRGRDILFTNLSGIYRG
jgi:hypothetical protein